MSYDRARRKVVRHGGDLGPHDIWWHGVDHRDAPGILGGDRGHRRGAEDAERLKRLEVGLNSGAAPTVAPGNGEHDGK